MDGRYKGTIARLEARGNMDAVRENDKRIEIEIKGGATCRTV